MFTTIQQNDVVKLNLKTLATKDYPFKCYLKGKSPLSLEAHHRVIKVDNINNQVLLRTGPKGSVGAYALSDVILVQAKQRKPKYVLV